MSFSIEIDHTPSESDLDIIEKGLDTFTENVAGIDDRKNLTFFLRNDVNEVIGGATGCYGTYGWLWVSTLWVSDQVRGQGYGIQLLNAIEQEAAKNGCVNAYLNSFSFSAVEFYKTQGYTVYAELEDFPPGHSVCSLRKKLELEKDS
ncbi:MAG: GNAT family N-acetyltransferase [Aliivibrio sp.]|uniref:GNAT family N-acetyltransferase n=1 Tax=Aliivibrio sp. TaxID=1872443 RepID=UPI001A479F51|nr:GNAT family N-acetyltransferase [Aliivibrio sp.]